MLNKQVYHYAYLTNLNVRFLFVYKDYNFFYKFYYKFFLLKEQFE